MALSVSLDYFVRPTTDTSADGSIFINVTGGKSPYTYAWTYGALSPTTKNLTNLNPPSSSTIQVVVTDADLNTDTLILNINMSAINPSEDLVITDRDGEIHLFPDYLSQINYAYNAGSIEGLKTAITEQLEIPMTERNLDIVDGYKIQLRNRESILFNGFIEVIGHGENIVNPYIEVQILDDAKFFVRQLKKTKIYELLEDGEYNHKFRLARIGDTFDGIELLTDVNELVRYVFQDYNGFQDESSMALNRYTEEFTGGDGIQHVQPVMMLNKMIERIEGKFNVDIISNFFDDTLSGYGSTDKLGIQFPMRYHGFDLDLRKDSTFSEIPNRHVMLGGFVEKQYQSSNFSNSFPIGNFRYNNRLAPTIVFNQDSNGFGIFHNSSTPSPQDWFDQWNSTNWIQQQTKGFRVVRSGTYKFLFQRDTFPDMTLMYCSELANSTSNLWQYQYHRGFAGTITLNFAVSVNGRPPVLAKIKDFITTDFSNSSELKNVNGNDHYLYRTAPVGSADTETEEIELRTGDYVEYFFVLTSEDSEWNVAEFNYQTSTVTSTSPPIPMTEVTGRSFSSVTSLGGRRLLMYFDFDTANLRTDSDLLNGYSSTATFPAINLNSNRLALGRRLSLTQPCESTKPYPLISTYDTEGLARRYEEVDLKRNYQEFVDLSLYDVLKDVMGRFNMGIWYSPVAKAYYIDNFQKEFLSTATANNITYAYDDDSILKTNFKNTEVNILSLENEKGNSIEDVNTDGSNFGDLEELEINPESDNDLSYSSIMTIANGKCYGDYADQSIFTSQERIDRYIPIQSNLQVSDYGIRIGFVRDDLSVPVSIYIPSITPLYNPNSSNLFDPVRYFKVTRDGFELPLFTNFDVDGANHYYLDFANDGVAEPSSPITNVYEYFWKDYIATMFGKNSYEGSFVFDLETGLLLSPTQLYDFGRGDCFITGFDSLNLFEKRSKVLLKLRQYG